MKFFGLEITKRAASLESPTTLLNPAKWLIDYLGGGATNTGLAVTPAKAMEFSAVYAAVSLIAQTVAQLRLLRCPLPPPAMRGIPFEPETSNLSTSFNKQQRVGMTQAPPSRR